MWQGLKQEEKRNESARVGAIVGSTASDWQKEFRARVFEYLATNQTSVTTCIQQRPALKTTDRMLITNEKMATQSVLLKPMKSR